MGWGTFIAGQAIGSIRGAGRNVPRATRERDRELHRALIENEKRKKIKRKEKQEKKELRKAQQSSKTFRF